MNCPNCGEEMVEGECSTEQNVGTSHAGLWARPVEHDFWGRPHTMISRRMQVCYHCGLVQLFVLDPTIFRPRDGTENLPRPAENPAPQTDTLPRSSDGEGE